MQTATYPLIRIILLWIILSMQIASFAQCSSPISLFPYKENFETGNGGWFDGGFASDWILGAPSKNLIKNAASGNNCWITGGLSGNFYNDGERSWLQSPCFDFSALKNPVISFAVFWDTELGYDGAGFQYSLDNGITWNVIGSIGDACPNNNWYNANINYLPDLGQSQGWSGSVGNGGSGSWINAMHELSDIAGKPNVIFRFVFAAGTKYNNFNGFAVDDISISEETTNNVSFTYSCIDASTVNFTSGFIPCNATVKWNFDDPLSGINNTSTQANPIHIFSEPRVHDVRLTMTNLNGATSIDAQNINIIALSTVVLKPVSCINDKSGSVLVDIKGSNAEYNIEWNTDPVQTMALANNLPAGNYTVTVSEKKTCTATSSINLVTTEPLKVFLGDDTDLCPGSFLVLDPGNFTNYLWQDGSTLSTYKVIREGNYNVQVTNAEGCKASDSIEIIQDCGNIFFPSAFTPNGDGLNDDYGPKGNLSLLKQYSLIIYDRWGKVVFSTNNPFDKWKGNSKFQADTYTYYVHYMYNNTTKFQKGTISVIF